MEHSKKNPKNYEQTNFKKTFKILDSSLVKQWSERVRHVRLKSSV